MASSEEWRWPSPLQGQDDSRTGENVAGVVTLPEFQLILSDVALVILYRVCAFGFLFVPFLLAIFSAIFLLESYADIVCRFRRFAFFQDWRAG